MRDFWIMNVALVKHKEHNWKLHILWSLVYLNFVCVCVYIYIYIYIYICILTKSSSYGLHSSLAWHSLVISLWLLGHTRDVQPQQSIILIIPC